MPPYDNDAQIAALMDSLTNRPPTPEQVVRIEHLRDAAKELGVLLITVTPSSPNRTHAIRQLEDSIMWAVKAIVLETPTP